MALAHPTPVCTGDAAQRAAAERGVRGVGLPHGPRHAADGALPGRADRPLVPRVQEEHDCSGQYWREKNPFVEAVEIGFGGGGGRGTVFVVGGGGVVCGHLNVHQQQTRVTFVSKGHRRV